MKYVIYLRVSTDLQDTRTQQELILKFIRNRDKSDFKYLVFSDEISSRKALKKRKGIMGALNALSAGDILIGMRVDRLARNSLEAETIKETVLGKNAGLVMVEQNVKDPFMFAIHAAVAAQEVSLIRKRIQEKLEVKSLRNERISHVIPYGYKLDTKNLIWIHRKGQAPQLKPGLLLPNEAESETLTRIIQLFDEGYSYRSIVLQLEEEGYRNRVGKPFQHSSVYRILARTGRTRSLNQCPEESKMSLFH